MLHRRRYINRILLLRRFLNRGETIFDNAKLGNYYRDTLANYYCSLPNVECIKDYNMEECSLKVVAKTTIKMRYHKKKRR